MAAPPGSWAPGCWSPGGELGAGDEWGWGSFRLHGFRWQRGTLCAPPLQGSAQGELGTTGVSLGALSSEPKPAAPTDAGSRSGWLRGVDHSAMQGGL